LGKGSKATVIYFGLEDKNISIGKPPHASDFTNCIACGKQLTYDEVYMAHLGKYKCPDCGLVRPKPDIFATDIKLLSEKGFEAKIVTPKGEIVLKSPLPGLYNVYNCLAAIAAGIVLGIPLGKIKEAIEIASPAFGRTEQLELDGKKIYISLVKNPTGFNEVIRTIFQEDKKKNLLIAINDLIADGKDVSWLWDVDFEFIMSKIKKIWVSGIRTNDMTLRLKYTGAKKDIIVDDNLENAIGKAIDGTQIGDTLYILPTYTAMLQLKKILANAGVSSNFWED
jgi:UDP-N-acetylmuramyl tripeptide synthase